MFQYCITTDFACDIGRAAFDRDMLRQMMRVLRSWQVERIYWMDWRDYSFFGPLNGAQWDKIQATMRNLDNNVLGAAVEAGHGEGLEVYALIKPFEGGYLWPHAGPAPLPPDTDGVNTLNNFAMHCDTMMRERPHLRMKHRLADAEAQRIRRPVARLEIESNAATEPRLDASTFHLLTSADNRGYRLCDQPYTFRKEPVQAGGRVVGWRMRIEGLSVAEPYLMFVMENASNVVTNHWRRLVRAYDDNGVELPSAPGWTAMPAAARDVSQISVVFNRLGNTGDGVWGQRLAKRDDLVFDRAGDKFFALAIGVDPYVSGALCPAESDVRAAWLERTAQCLEAGVDGVDYRIKSHNMPLEWEDYGYNDAVLEQYRQRYGREISDTEEDIERKAQILGDGYTQFVRESSRLIRSAGRKMQHHFSDDFFREPDRSWHSMGIAWQWKTWLEEGLLDAVTLKNSGVQPDEPVRRIGGAAAVRYGVPFYYSPWHSSARGRPVTREIIRHEAMRARQDPEAAGFTFYETAAVLDITEGSVRAYYGCPWEL